MINQQFHGDLSSFRSSPGAADLTRLRSTAANPSFQRTASGGR
jgi:hypothetical protein